MASAKLIGEIDKIIERYEELEKNFGFPIQGAIFDCIKKAQTPDGSLPSPVELHIQKRLKYPVTRQRRLRSFYDFISKGIEGGATGEASEELFHMFSNGGEALKIRVAGPLLENWGPDSHTLKNYVEHGGYEAAEKAMKISQDEIISQVEKSNIRGRGGAYFPAGIKWRDAMNRTAEHKFLVCNADEGEPPTVKDKVLMDYKPHQLIEGMLITGKAIGANLGIIYIRGDYDFSIQRLEKAIGEAHKEGWLGDNIKGTGFKFEIIVFKGSGSYVAGASGAMVESIEGKAAIPRSKLYRLTQNGINGMPTVINNVETLSYIPFIVKNGGEAFAKIGASECPGTKLYGLCGDVKKPGIYELPTGIVLKELIEEYGGGVAGGKLKAVSPGGATTALLSAGDADVKMDPESLREKRTSLGSGAVAVFNDKRNIREYAAKVLQFLGEESCGKCMQCPIIIANTLAALERMDKKNAEMEGDLIMDTAKRGTRPLNCELGKGSHNVVVSAMKKFPEDFFGKQF